MPAAYLSCPRRRQTMTWPNKTRPNKTAKLPYGYAVSENDPLVLIPDPEIIRWVEAVRVVLLLEPTVTQRVMSGP